MKKNETLVAFTLAEFLITLIIIGIISIILIVPLVQHIQDYEFVSKLKKTYSVLTQATKSMQLQNASLGTYSADEFFNEITSNIKITKKCANAQECFGATGTYLTQYSFVDVNGVYYSVFKGYWAYAITRAGVSSKLYTNTTADWFISVDLNGKAKPNTAGQDRFSFVYSSQYGLLPSGSGTTSFSDGRGLWGLGDNTALVISSGKLYR